MMIRAIKKADLFGVNYSQPITRENTFYRSILGGFFSIIIIMLSLGYTTWVIIQWQMNLITPKVTTSLYVSDFSHLDLNYDIVKINFWKQSEDLIDPFEENVLLPIAVYTQNFSSKQSIVLKKSNQTTMFGNYFYIPKLELGFNKIDGQLMATSEVTIWFVLCKAELLNNGEKCADEKTISKFFQQSYNTIIVRQNFRQINPQDQSIEEIEQLYFFYIEDQSCYTLSFYLQTTLFEIRNDLLFGTNEQKEYITDTQLQAQTNSVQYCTRAFGFESYGSIYITMKNTQKKTVYQYPNAGDLCANIGSITSILFMIRHIIIYINQFKLQEKLIKDLITIYYPEFKQLVIQKNWRNQIKSVKLNQRLIDKNDFIEFNNRLRKQILEKLSYFNLLYEISRIYIVLRSIKKKEEMKKSHLVGAKINLKEQLQDDSPQVSPKKRGKSDLTELLANEQIFNDEEIDLLSLQTRYTIMQSSKAENLISYSNDSKQGNDFYDLNKIF